ncbi:MAG: pyridoxal phosphate-dependent aminotransferase [Smithellaceae bacterium]|nr:pyridoxal phosphate-dependent aminotransferase [Syntrophaceae bacterium]MDX9816127.1 pyridoxal phosphate-dependent aminotransferase [Smithellaceae bacterium]NMD05203.1 pyridoxal phosphate-dependent aminotransferase [Deltaproteobacteria bacterium]OPZ52452.1 MAG: Aspartate aminotransferase [Deltaproteobacteria bacterium ADurb.BinA014]MBP8609510.1 pyridoxal phosphate-dependent aminotransferase [Syntrophaceae bacterium]
MKLAARVAKIKPSETLAITAKVNALRAQGRDVIGFGAGEPDFDTPDNIKKAAIQAIEAGFTKYTPVNGTDELKDAIAAKLKRDNSLEYKRSQIVVSCGAKHSLYNLAQALFDEGDEVIIPAPYWVSYPDIVALSGGEPVIVDTQEENGFKMSPRQLSSAITKRTRAVIINSPSNPTGAVYTPQELKALAAVLVDKDILVITDDIYEKIFYADFPFANIASVEEKMKEKTIVINGVSKTYAMTGWRIGYAACSEEIAGAMSKIQSQSTSNPTSIAQKAALEAIRGDQSAMPQMVVEFRKRRDFIVEALNNIEGIDCFAPGGAFYVFPKVSSLYGRMFKGKKITDSAEFIGYLLDEANVAAVPGAAFGSDEHIRLSYATSLQNIEEGLKRIKNAVGRLD